jgi:hypothetical protein
LDITIPGWMEADRFQGTYRCRAEPAYYKSEIGHS